MIPILRAYQLRREELAHLLAESERAGFALVRRLIEDWERGTNRFDRSGEALFIATEGAQVVGVCGLNIDPFLSSPRVGRVRHLYVAEAHRRRGIGRELVGAVIHAARGSFDRLRLRTNTAQAARFYESLGFRPCAGDDTCTHALDLERR